MMGCIALNGDGFTRRSSRTAASRERVRWGFTRRSSSTQPPTRTTPKLRRKRRAGKAIEQGAEQVAIARAQTCVEMAEKQAGWPPWSWSVAAAPPPSDSNLGSPSSAARERWGRTRRTRRCSGRGWAPPPALPAPQTPPEDEWHGARLASLNKTHTVTWEEFKKKQKEEEMKRGEMEADKDKMMREYRAQLDVERALSLLS